MERTNSGLLAYAVAQLGLPYWYGTYGQVATAALHTAKKKQYPAYYKATDFATQYGKRVFDCIGLVKGYLWSDSTTGKPKYTAEQDKSARGMYNAAKVKGKIATFPKRAGLLVFKSQSNSASGINHVGIYDGAGFVIEAKGHKWGVVKTKFEGAGWKFWAQCPYTEDDTTGTAAPEAVKTASVELPQLKQGAKGETVKAMQALLIGRGVSCGESGVDGSFGPATDAALRQFQSDKGLTVDGICGKNTWAALLGV